MNADTKYCYAIVKMFNEHRKCRVRWFGAPLVRFGPDQTIWVERAEDEYAAINRKGIFCILDKSDWLKGSKISGICEKCGDDLEQSPSESDEWDVVYADCRTCSE